jgi:hypothetical protein
MRCEVQVEVLNVFFYIILYHINIMNLVLREGQVKKMIVLPFEGYFLF